MLKNGLPIRWTWVGESWQMPAKNCTFSTESAHTSTMHGNTVITIKRIIFYLLHSHSHSLSPCLSICLSAFSSFFFTFPFHFFCFIFLLPFQFKFHFVSVSLFIFCLYGCLCFYTLYCSLSFSLYVYHICYFSISGRFISHGNKQRFQLKKKIIHFNNSIWSLGTRPTEQKREASRTKDIIKIVGAK